MDMRLVAVAIALSHALLCVFLVAALPFAVRRPRLMKCYLIMLVPTAVVNLLQLACPLTVWEKNFWRLAGDTPYQGGFISNYFVKPFYSPGLSPNHELLILLFMVIWCSSWLLYSLFTKFFTQRRIRSTSTPNSSSGLR